MATSNFIFVIYQSYLHSYQKSQPILAFLCSFLESYNEHV